MALDEEDLAATRGQDEDPDLSDLAATHCLADEDELAATHFSSDAPEDDLAATRAFPSDAPVAPVVEPPPGLPDLAATVQMESPEEAALADRTPQLVIEDAIEEALSTHPPPPASPMPPAPQAVARPSQGPPTVPPPAHGSGLPLGAIVAAVLAIIAVLVAIAILAI